ncbi:MAG: hypothetical protein M1835_006884 [Candelina submexicana]|nr:MAG: hypothetical protein M1835_006884 [Candelina submexicana]
MTPRYSSSRKRSRDELETTSGHRATSDLSLTPLEQASVSGEDLRQALNGISVPERRQNFSSENTLPATPTPASSPINRSNPQPAAESRKARRINPSETSPGSNFQDPRVNDVAQLLGVGWTRLKDDECSKAGARGWAKYIENHYQMTNPIVLLHSDGLSAYLVEAKEGYFLFSEDLKEAKLVSVSWERCIAGLQAYPPLCEGSHPLTAAQTPPPIVNGNGSLLQVLGGKSDEIIDGLVMPQVLMDTD